MLHRGADKSVARPGRKQTTATKLYILQATKKKIQNVVRPTRSPRQQWPPRRTKMATFQLFLQSGWAKDLSAPLYREIIAVCSEILKKICKCTAYEECWTFRVSRFNPYPIAFPYGNGMVLHFYQQQESSTTKTVHKVINKGLKAYV